MEIHLRINKTTLTAALIFILFNLLYKNNKFNFTN